MKEIYTIGYSSFKIEDFIQTLKNNNITCVIDVRSNPFSEYFQDYNKDILEKKLKKENIMYRNYKKEFGARQEEPSFYPKGYLDFDLFTKSEQFNEGVLKIAKGIEMGFSFVLMCAEKDPITCHRNIMVAKAFKERGYNIKHILFDGSIESQDDIEKRMIKEYFPERNQMALFDENKSDEDLIKASYNKKNEEIGYRIAEEGEKYE
jgi:uncharacterized protein (DUF488 family)